MQKDLINSPSHYNEYGFEVYDFIKSVIPYIKEKNIIFDIGNALKYALRSKHKGNEIIDLKKCEWYILRCADYINNDAFILNEKREFSENLTKLSKKDFRLFLLVENIISFALVNSQRNHSALVTFLKRYIRERI